MEVLSKIAESVGATEDSEGKMSDILCVIENQRQGAWIVLVFVIVLGASLCS